MIQLPSVDLQEKQFVDATTYQSARLHSTRAIVLHLDAISISTNQYDLLLAIFPRSQRPISCNPLLDME